MRSSMRWARSLVEAAVVAAFVVAAGTACAPAAATLPAEHSSGGSLAGVSQAAERSLVMPVEGVRVNDVVSNFGAPRGDRIHEGVDIAAPTGTPVYSAGYGVVYFLGSTGPGGWTVWVEHGDRDFWYTHLSGIAPDLTEGASVTPRTLLGWVGHSGNASEASPHLHFEVVLAGVPIDPLPMLTDRF